MSSYLESLPSITGNLGDSIVIFNEYVLTTSEIEGGTRLTITHDGDEVQVVDIMDGHTPVKGVDYWSEADKTEMAEAAKSAALAAVEDVSTVKDTVETMAKRVSTVEKDISAMKSPKLLKTWCCIGDSITQMDLYENAIKNELGITTLYTRGVIGSTVAVNSASDTAIGENKSFWYRVVHNAEYGISIPNADIFTILGGINDWMYGSPLGEIDSTDEHTFYGAYKAIVEYILRLPNKPQLLLITPTWVDLSRRASNPVDPSITFPQIRKAICEIAENYSLPVVDLLAESGINPINAAGITNPTTADGVHWNNYGKWKCIPLIRKGLLNLNFENVTYTFNSMSQIVSIVRGNSVEQNALIFPVGDYQIVASWKDMDDPAHNTDETAYQVAWDIVHHGPVTLRDGSVVPGMFIMMHLCSAFGVQFSHQQGFYQAAEELPAGTYHVNFGVKYNDTFTAGTSGQFTLASAVPAGGRLCFSGANVQVFTTAESAAAAETVTMTIGNGGADLGTISSNNALSDTGLNAMNRILYGHDRWSTSAIRQYLHARGLNWFSSKEDFDIRPDQYNKHGFMSGFNDDFLSAIQPVKVTTALNTVEGFTDATEDTFDTFFLPSLEQINAKPQLADVEGPYFEYWRRRMGLNGFINYQWEAEPNKSGGLLIPAINAQTSPQTVRLRSANRDHENNTWNVHSSGYVGNSNANDALRFSLVCVIC